ncbi:uncharacterized protein LOC119572625 [Penaeus monodon]|uniref:uncharacterized protein LOC119572625 n=1 Tax=Penaeus monodon TaxID=6687 RepID=UPI0018A7C764|nr:uncharacterized protein LOC119572625 [Penaeus monodon]
MGASRQARVTETRDRDQRSRPEFETRVRDQRSRPSSRPEIETRDRDRVRDQRSRPEFETRDRDQRSRPEFETGRETATATFGEQTNRGRHFAGTTDSPEDEQKSNQGCRNTHTVLISCPVHVTVVSDSIRVAVGGTFALKEEDSAALARRPRDNDHHSRQELTSLLRSSPHSYEAHLTPTTLTSLLRRSPHSYDAHLTPTKLTSL